MVRLAEQAASGSGATIGDLAQSERLPRKYLEQVLRDLRRAGILDSKPGPGGGCWLARPASEITVGDVVRALDGEISPGHCLEHDADATADDCPGCWGFATCSIRELLLRLQASINGILDGETIAQLAARQSELNPVAGPEYVI